MGVKEHKINLFDKHRELSTDADDSRPHLLLILHTFLPISIPLLIVLQWPDIRPTEQLLHPPMELLIVPLAGKFTAI
jgi:hypothetical protein